jgi:hypothetical protein
MYEYKTVVIPILLVSEIDVGYAQKVPFRTMGNLYSVLVVDFDVSGRIGPNLWMDRFLPVIVFDQDRTQTCADTQSEP